jgi:hypothetical protein
MRNTATLVLKLILSFQDGLPEFFLVVSSTAFPSTKGSSYDEAPTMVLVIPSVKTLRSPSGARFQ